MLYAIAQALPFIVIAIAFPVQKKWELYQKIATLTNQEAININTNAFVPIAELTGPIHLGITEVCSSLRCSPAILCSAATN